MTVIVDRGRYAFGLANVNDVSARVDERFREAACPLKSVSGEAI